MKTCPFSKTTAVGSSLCSRGISTMLTVSVMSFLPWSRPQVRSCQYAQVCTTCPEINLVGRRICLWGNSLNHLRRPSSTVKVARMEGFRDSSGLAAARSATKVHCVFSNRVLPCSYSGQPREMAIRCVVLGGSWAFLTSYLKEGIQCLALSFHLITHVF